MTNLFVTCVCVLVLFNIKGCSPCGGLTHIEISQRAEKNFQQMFPGTVDYAQLIHNHSDALMAGSPYPDAYYDSLCMGGKYHSVSEDTHWAPYINATANYIRKRFPHPWDEATQKLVVFMFGVLSHQTADILWHSLGIDQGFLSTMGNVNFHGSFDAAHSAGDLGGEVLNSYELYLNVPTWPEWYIPTDDLYNIYVEYYGQDDISKLTIVDCTSQLYVAHIAEVLAIGKLFPNSAKKSPFMVNQLSEFFLGGLDDMAGWTHNIWQEYVTMLEKGTSFCDIPHNTLFMHCNQTKSPLKTNRKAIEKSVPYKPPLLNGLTKDDLIVTRKLRGISIRPKKAVWERIREKFKTELWTAWYKQKKDKEIRNKLGNNPRVPTRQFQLHNSYGRFGYSYTTGDLNGDGRDDLVIGAPGWGRLDSPQEGRVYVLYATDDGIPYNLTESNLDDIDKRPKEGQILRGFGTLQSRFGTAVAVVDINLDGVNDLAVGAPSYMSEAFLQYHGVVHIYFGNRAKNNLYGPNITLTCRTVKYCNLGFSLTTADINRDNHSDLVVGSPFKPGPATGQDQAGFLAAYIANTNNFGYTEVPAESLKWKKTGNQSYSWFGYDIYAYETDQNDAFLVIQQPQYRLCVYQNCSYSPNDTQSVGRMMYQSLQVQEWKPVVLTGMDQFAQLGFSSAMGRPYPDKSTVLAVGVIGEDVTAHVAGDPMNFEQSGGVHVYSITKGLNETAFFRGDRRFSRFGYKVKFADLNGDGFDDLIIGAPYRTIDFTEELESGERGEVYVYYGGKDFPRGDGTSPCGNSLIEPCAGYTASETLTHYDNLDKVRVGTNFEVLKSKNKVQLFVTAEHDSSFARLSGNVLIYEYPKS